jgi:hypothetical protein
MTTALLLLLLLLLMRMLMMMMMILKYIPAFANEVPVFYTHTHTHKPVALLCRQLFVSGVTQ